MGSEQSQPNKPECQTPSPMNNLNELNWIPSFQILRYPGNQILNISSDDEQAMYIDLRRHMPGIPDPDNKCYQVVKAFCFALNYELVRSRKITVFPPSYEYLKYFLETSIDSVQLHSFHHLSEVIKNFGICSETECRGDQQRSSGPTDDLLESARKYRHIQLKIMEPIVTDDDVANFNYVSIIKHTLLEGKVVLLGMPWYSNFLKSQEMPALSLPTPDDFIQGGFCGVVVGFIDKDQQWIVATCRGKSWGDHGYIYLPYHVLTKIGAELVTIELNEELIQLELDSKRYVNATITNNRRMINHRWKSTSTPKTTNQDSDPDIRSITRTLY